MASPEVHRTTAEDLLSKAQSYGPSSPARLAVLMEAQIHATLYAAEITALAAAPVRINLPAEPADGFEGDYKPSTGLLIPSPEEAPAPTTKRPRRKPASAPKEATE